jgi:hypothetical protein
MKIKKILIEVDLDSTDNQNHATLMEFQNGIWTNDGGLYPRISHLQSILWKLLKVVLIDSRSINDISFHD